jgi:hypothetical protein
MREKILRKKLKGNTLPEVMIALTIITFCSTMGIIIYLNIQESTMPFIRMKSNEIAVKALNESIAKKDYFDGSTREEEFTINKVVLKNPIYPDCMDIKITVLNIQQKKTSELVATVYAE